MTLAVAHRTMIGTTVLDCLRERRPPFSPADVVAEFAATLRAYRVSTVTGDRYAGEWPREAFRGYGIRYQPAETPKSEYYGSLLPLINAGKVELLDLPRLIAQLVSLERRTARSGRDSIDHGPGGHDDVVNAAAGALVTAEALGGGRLVFGSIGGWAPDQSRGPMPLVITNPDHFAYTGPPRHRRPANANSSLRDQATFLEPNERSTDDAGEVWPRKLRIRGPRRHW